MWRLIILTLVVVILSSVAFAAFLALLFLLYKQLPDSELVKWLFSALPNALAEAFILGAVGVVLVETFRYRGRIDVLYHDLESAIAQGNQEEVEAIHSNYRGILHEYPLAQSKKFEELYQRACKGLSLSHEANIDWDNANLKSALSKLRSACDQIPNCRPLNERYELINGLLSADSTRVLQSLKACSGQSPSWLLNALMQLARSSNEFPKLVKKDQSLESEVGGMLREIEQSRITTGEKETARYLFQVLLSQRQPLPRHAPQTDLERWLDVIGYDFARSMALIGRAEDEPETDYPLFYIGGWPDVIRVAEHSVVIGESGCGKTMLSRMLRRECTSASKHLFVRWISCIELVEEQQELPVSKVISSLIQDVNSALEQDERWGELSRGQELFLKKEPEKPTWRQVLRDLKDDLKSKGIEAIFIGIDGLDHYPETWHHRDRVHALLTALLRPEVLEDNQPWFVKLFISPRLYQQIKSILQPAEVFKLLHLDWNEENLKALIQQRLRYMQRETLSLATPSLQEIADARLERSILEQAKSPGRLVMILRALMTHRAEKWATSGCRDDELNIRYEDWEEIKGRTGIKM